MNKFIEPLKLTFLYELIFPIVQSVQVLNWLLRGRNLLVPHLIKQWAVKSYGRKYRVRIFIETGTYLGVMVNATKGNFKKIYTIELDKKLYERAKNKFKRFDHIKVLYGDSTKVLPKILEQIQKPCLFWLDAHYSKGITTKGNKESPIMDELSCILNHKIKNHVILIDDVNTFVGKNDYPELNELKKFILKKRPYMKFDVLNNIIRISPY